MVRAILIDDEAAAIRTLTSMLSRYCEGVEVIATATNAFEGIKIIQEHQPDLVFLDIQMPQANGFKVLEAFPDRRFEVVFVTAHLEFTLHALHQQAFDYLLKPTDIDELKRVVEKFKKSKRNPSATNPANFTLQRVSITTNEGFVFVDVPDIIMLRGDGNYTHFYCTKEKYTVSKNLKSFCEKLEGMGFYRSHQSYLINLKAVTGYSREGVIQLKGNCEAKLSRNKKDGFFELLDI